MGNSVCEPIVSKILNSLISFQTEAAKCHMKIPRLKA